MSEGTLKLIHPAVRGAAVDSANLEVERFRAEQHATIETLGMTRSTTPPPAGTFKLKCLVKSTGQELGYLGISTANSVDLVGADARYVAICEWYPWGSVYYLRVNNATVYRYLGVGTESSACWGLWTGWINPVEPRNGGIGLTGNDRLLYPYGDSWAYWGNTIINIAVDYIKVS